MLQSPGNGFEKAEMRSLCLVNSLQAGVDDHRCKTGFLQQGHDGFGPCTAGKVDARQDALMGAGHRRRGVGRRRFDDAGSFEEIGKALHQPLGKAGIDEIAVDDQQLAARFQHTPPFGKASRRIDQCPDEMPGNDDVVAVISLENVFRIAKMITDHAVTRRGLGACLLQHGLRPVDAGHLVAQIDHQVRNHAGAAGKVECPAALAPPEMPFDQCVPGHPLVLGKNLVAG